MNKEDHYKLLYGAYYGVAEMDEYDTKEYILQELKEYINSFQKDNPIEDFDYEEFARNIDNTMPLKTKLQDSLIVLPKIEAPIELILLVKKRLKDIREEELENL